MSGSDEPRIGDAAPGGIEDVSVVQGWSKIRVIQNVEKLGAKLNIEAIRDPLDVVVLEQGEIEGHQSGSNECVPAQIPAERHGIRDRKALGLDVADGIPRIHQRTATRPGNEIRDINVWVSAFYPESVAPKTRSERHACAGLEHASYLPAWQEGAILSALDAISRLHSRVVKA